MFQKIVIHLFHARGNKYKAEIKSYSLKAGISYLNFLDWGDFNSHYHYQFSSDM